MRFSVRRGRLPDRAGGPARRPVEDREDLRRALVRPDRVRDHRGELGRLTGLDEQDPLAQVQPGGAGQHGEPLAPGVHARRSGPEGVLGGDAHLGDGDAAALRARGTAARSSPARVLGSGRITTSSSSADSTSWSRVVPSARAMGRAGRGRCGGGRSRCGSGWTGSGSSGPPARRATSPRASRRPRMRCRITASRSSSCSMRKTLCVWHKRCLAWWTCARLDTSSAHDHAGHDHDAHTAGPAGPARPRRPRPRARTCPR